VLLSIISPAAAVALAPLRRPVPEAMNPDFADNKVLEPTELAPVRSEAATRDLAASADSETPELREDVVGEEEEEEEEEPLDPVVIVVVAVVGAVAVTVEPEEEEGDELEDDNEEEEPVVVPVSIVSIESINPSLKSPVIAFGPPSCKEKMCSITVISRLVVSVPQKATQSLTTNPPPINPDPLLTVPGTKGT